MNEYVEVAMAGGVICTNIVSHTPRMGVEENAPEFVHGLIEGQKEMGRFLREMKPDLFVIHSTHWVSTFLWFATAQAVHEGLCVADEAPDMIPGVPYRYQGDPEFAGQLIANLKGSDIPASLNESEHYRWDYGTYVPLHYLDPDAEIPVVGLPVCMMSQLDENMDVGRRVHDTAVATGKRVIFLASNALSHRLVRGPDQWPSPERMEMDKHFIELATSGQVRPLIDYLPEFAEDAVAEMGGRVMASFMGTLDAMDRTLGDRTAAGAKFSGRQFGAYGQSSGSGNANLAIWTET